jgi:hypothetical protein
MINQEPLITSDKDGMALMLNSTSATDLGKRKPIQLPFTSDKDGMVNACVTLHLQPTLSALLLSVKTDL